jgi:hypothetical protein
MAVMLIISGTVMYLLESISIKAEMKFPIVNCEDIAKDYMN